MSDTHSASPADSPEKKPAKKSTAKKAAKKTARKVAKKTAKKETPAAEPKPQASKPQASKPAATLVVKEPAPAQDKAPAQNNEQTQSSEQNSDQGNKQQNGRVKGYNRNNRGRQNNNNNRGKQNKQKNQDQEQDQNQDQDQNQNKQNQRGNKNNRNRNNRGKQNNNNRNNNRNKNNRDNNNQNNNNNRERRPQKVELTGPAIKVNGMLELAPKGFGFLRTLDSGLEQSSTDVFVTPDIIRSLGLRLGVWIHGEAMQGPQGPQLTTVETINGKTPEQACKLPHFEELKAINPDKRIVFETTGERFTTRVLDIIAPVGRGQRGLIVSPPRSGKTTLMMHMAEAVKEKYDESMHLMILLVDERPEEVTEFKLSLPDTEVFSSSNDAGAKNHCRVAELCIERAKRLVEAGEHVFILMDSITRLARAYNAAMGGGKQGRGRGIQSGGIISGALEMPRRLFAAARNTRTAGSLTIVATALVHTNSRADDAIFQEFKGTGNMELVLDRRIAEQYIYPAVDIFKSGTRREELLLPEIQLHKINLIRRGLAGHRPEEAMERLNFFLKRFDSNAQMLLEIKG